MYLSFLYRQEKKKTLNSKWVEVVKDKIKWLHDFMSHLFMLITFPMEPGDHLQGSDSYSKCLCQGKLFFVVAVM